MNKKRIISLMLVLAMLFMVGCQADKKPGTTTTPPAQSPANSSATSGENRPLKVALLITSILGDKGFYDSAHAGLALIEKEFPGSTTKVVEMGQDPSTYDANIRDIADGDWDYIIVGSSPVLEVLSELAPQYPDKKFIIFDFEMDWNAGDFSNVYSVNYKQNEGTFVAGMVAAIATTELPNSNPEKVIGFIGGMDLPIINDFLIGYIEGAQYIEPDIKVAISYAGVFTDSAKGKELGLSQITQNKADVMFAAASATGIGTLEAAQESGVYAIGVDGDQEAAFRETNPALADSIITSMLKKVDVSLLRAVKLAEEGKLPWGANETIGINEDGVGIVVDGRLKEVFNAEQMARIEEGIEKVKSGEIKISSAMGMEPEEFQKIANAVKP